MADRVRVEGIGGTLPVPKKRRARTRRPERPEYRAWSDMIARCTSPNNRLWSRYGGRGIRVCQRWLESFDAFQADMGSRPGPKFSIDRKNNDGNYEPGNCRWATPEQQAGNRSISTIIEWNGESLHLQEWERRTGINRRTIKQRLVNGWTVERALTTPARRRS